MVPALDEDINLSHRGGCCRGIGGHDSAERLPLVPVDAIRTIVPELAVQPGREDVQAIRVPEETPGPEAGTPSLGAPVAPSRHLLRGQPGAITPADPEKTLLVLPWRLARIERWFLRAGAFLLPLAYSWDTYDQYVLPRLLMTRVLVIGLAILFVARTIVSRSLAMKRSALDLPLLVFVASALLSTVFAYNQNVALFGTYSRYDGLITILTYAALFWLSVQVLTGPADARALLRVLLASGYLVAALAIQQSVTASVAQGALVPAVGTLGQQNVLGAFLAMLCPLACRELVEAESWSMRIIAINLLAVLGAALRAKATAGRSSAFRVPAYMPATRVRPASGCSPSRALPSRSAEPVTGRP